MPAPGRRAGRRRQRRQVEEHWAYVKPVRPAPPAVSNARPGSATPIDRFVLARLDAETAARRRPRRDGDAAPPRHPRPDRPAADARRGRRLPRRHRARTPTSGWSTGCWRRRTTASAGRRRWLDLARYADTNGYEKDDRRGRSGRTATGSSTPSTATCRSTSSPSSSSPATCCPNATREQKIATGFHRNTLINEEGGIDPTRSSAFDVARRPRQHDGHRLARHSRIGCAQCHNHKYDPFTQKEYYRLLAFFASAGVRQPDASATAPATSRADARPGDAGAGERTHDAAAEIEGGSKPQLAGDDAGAARARRRSWESDGPRRRSRRGPRWCRSDATRDQRRRS